MYIYIITLFTKREYHRVEETCPHSFCYKHNTFIVLLQKHTRLYLYLYYNVIYKTRLPQGRGNMPTFVLLHTQHIYNIIVETHACQSLTSHTQSQYHYFFQLSTFFGSAWSFGCFIPAATANDLRLRRIFYPRLYPLHLFSYLDS